MRGAAVSGPVRALAWPHVDVALSTPVVRAATRTMACGSSCAVAAEQRGVRATVVFAGSGRTLNGTRGRAVPNFLYL